MKSPQNNPLTNKFLDSVFPSPNQEEIELKKIIQQLISGIIINEKPSPNKIHNELEAAASKRTFYRDIHKLAIKIPNLSKQILINLQKDNKMAMKSDGVISLDEHIIPHSGKTMEGVDFLYSTTEKKAITGMSIISTHYYRNHVEYPLIFQFYRRKQELEKWDKEDLYEEKNSIARKIINELVEINNSPNLFLMDSYFMAKENCKLLQNHKKNYISRPKRSWACSYKRHRQSISELYSTISASEFEKVKVRNPKNYKIHDYDTAIRDVNISGIGMHRLIFIKVPDKTPNTGLFALDSDKNDGKENNTSDSVDRFRVFVTNNLELDAQVILELYSLRWTVETNFRDLSQNLNLHGCKWREIAGQYCFITLSFLCYTMLTWASRHQMLEFFNPSLRTLGERRLAFKHYCQDEFSKWLSEIKSKCETCQLTEYIYEHLYRGE